MSEPVRAQPEEKPAVALPVVVKKYANRRLYNTESSSYITLDNLAEMIRQGRDFVVYDAKTGDDITRSVLTQIIVEEEGKGRAMLPTGFLRQLIGFYGDSVQNLVPRYLEQALAAFTQQQEQVREAVQQTMGRMFPFPGIEEMGRQNMAMMERALSLWSPFYRPQTPLPPGHSSQPAVVTEPDPAHEELSALRAEVEMLRRQLAEQAAKTAAAETTVKPGPAIAVVDTKG
jgi:polyhydroxyalkanoate synthesis repressor PhaR